MNLKKCIQKDLKKCDYTIYIDMNIMTLPKKGLRPCNIGMEKRDLKTRPYNIDMEKEDLKKLTKEQLIKLLLKQKKSKKVRNYEDLLNNDPFKDEVAQEPTKHIKPPKPTRKPPPPPILKLKRKSTKLA